MSNYELPRSTEWTPQRLTAVSRSVGLVVVGAVAFGIFATVANLYWIAAAIAGALMVGLVVWQFEAALAMYALVAFVPWGRTPDLAVGGSGLGKGMYVSQIMLGFLIVIWLGRYVCRALPKDRASSGFHVPLALYLAYSVVNVVHSFIFWDPHVDKAYQYATVNVIDLGFRFLSVGAFAMIATTVSSHKWLRWITVLLLIPGLYNLMNALVGVRIPLAAPWWPIVALLPVSYCWAVALDWKSSPWKRAVGASVTGVAVFVILVSGIGWVSGWLGLGAALATVTLVKSPRMFGIGLAVVVVAVAATWPFFHENVIVESQEQGDYDRFALLHGSWKYATTFPLGVGLGNYRSYNSFYYGEKWETTRYTSAHGTYAQHLSEMGIPGFLLFAGILVFGFRWMLKSYHELPPGLSSTYLLAAIGQLVGIAFAAFIGDYIIPTYHNGGMTTFSATVYSWLAWGLATAHVRIARAEENGPVNLDR